MKIPTFSAISLYSRWTAALGIMIGFAFFDLGKYEGAGYLVAIYLLLTAPEVIKKLSSAMNKRSE
ncbi:hypothetical protein DDO73_13925 [Vibrio cholerae]|nr:hypothetical protein [Vibrio cholerae]